MVRYGVVDDELTCFNNSGPHKRGAPVLLPAVCCMIILLLGSLFYLLSLSFFVFVFRLSGNPPINCAGDLHFFLTAASCDVIDTEVIGGSMKMGLPEVGADVIDTEVTRCYHDNGSTSERHG